MKDPEHAKMMLKAAANDFRAIEGMTDPEQFSDEIFGFHAQQVVEKSLKALLSMAGIAYPKIHDLEALFSLLNDHSVALPEEYLTLVDLTDFAVQFRYEAFTDSESGLDRAQVLCETKNLLKFVATNIV
jgi:HEPN domain-containing protein